MRAVKKRILYLFTAAVLSVAVLASSLTAKAADVKIAYDDRGTAYVIPAKSTLDEAMDDGNYLQLDSKLDPKGSDGNGTAFGSGYVWNQYQSELEAAGFNQRSFSYAYEAMLLDRAAQEFDSAGNLTGGTSLELNQFHSYMFLNDSENPRAKEWAEKYKKYKDNGSTEKEDDGPHSSDSSDSGWDAWINPLNVPENYAAQNTIEEGAGILIYILQVFGAFATILGFMGVILSMKQDDPGSKQKALMSLIGGLVLLSFAYILKKLGVIL